MMQEHLREIILKGLRQTAPEADLATLAPNENVREALDIDSYDFLQFLIGLNEELGVDIPESDYGQLVSLDDIVNYLAVRVAKKVP